MEEATEAQGRLDSARVRAGEALPASRKLGPTPALFSKSGLGRQRSSVLRGSSPLVSLGAGLVSWGPWASGN